MIHLSPLAGTVEWMADAHGGRTMAADSPGVTCCLVMLYIAMHTAEGPRMGDCHCP